MRSPALVIVVTATVLASMASHARTATFQERRLCEAKVQERIDAIDAKLRAGYSVRDGERLKDQRRKLEVERAKCRETK